MSHVERICSGFPVNLWFLRIRGKAVLNRYGNSSPPPFPNALSREDLFTMSAPDSITCQSAGLEPPLLGCDWPGTELPVEPPPLRFASTLLPCRPSPPALL